MTPDTTQLSDNSARGPTGFFKLPRELRDEIYDLVFENYWTESKDANIIGARYIFKARTPLPLPRLISRQFKREYDQRFPCNPCSLPPQIRPSKHCAIVDRPGLALRCTALEHRLDMRKTDCIWCDTWCWFS